MNGLADKIKRIVAVGAVAGAVIGAVGVPAYSYFVSDSVETKIIDTEIKRYDGRDKYLVFTDDGVFENTDAWYRGKFASSDIQRDCMKLKGKKAVIKKYGWRVPLTSSYENIVGVEEVKELSCT